MRITTDHDAHTDKPGETQIEEEEEEEEEETRESRPHSDERRE
jgi:hypothetical protein|tara:strand:- start:335 stop:463 length:129 start_codon:yes stop_codon:yes gene_type:complete